MKAQHEVAGFKMEWGFAYSKCRHCECNYEDMQEQFNEDLFIKRTMASHNRQCNDIEKANTDFMNETNFMNVVRMCMRNIQFVQVKLTLAQHLR